MTNDSHLSMWRDGWRHLRRLFSHAWRRLCGGRGNTEEQAPRRTVWPWVVGAVFVVVKLWLVSGQHITAIGFASIDDRLFLAMADHLLHFQWLGAYDQFTLAKGPFYPFWLAASYFAHVPLLYSQQLLYALACLVVTFALRPVLPRPWQRLLLFVVLLYDSASVANGPATRVIREGIYPALTLLTLGTFIGLACAVMGRTRRAVSWSIGAGVALSCFWLTREEGIWILPALGVILLIVGLFLFHKRPTSFKKRIILVTVPFLCLGLAIAGVSMMNYVSYRVFAVVEFKEANFLAAYGALTRVKASVWYADVPVSAKQRSLIYSVSPTFAQLRPSLEGNTGRSWIENGGQDGGEIGGGGFMWALRDAAAQVGVYTDGASASDFYGRMAAEVNTACDRKRIDCLPRNDSMMPPWDDRYIEPTLQAASRGVLRVARFEGISATPSMSVGFGKPLFNEITRSDVMTQPDKSKMAILDGIGRVYGAVAPYLAIVALVLLVVGVFLRRVSLLGGGVVLTLGVALFARIAVLSLVEATSFPVMEPLYLSSAYPIFLLLVCLSLLLVLEGMSSNRQ